MAKIVYLRTDKNGTKYYANYTCPMESVRMILQPMDTKP